MLYIPSVRTVGETLSVSITMGLTRLCDYLTALVRNAPDRSAGTGEGGALGGQGLIDTDLDRSYNEEADPQPRGKEAAKCHLYCPYLLLVTWTNPSATGVGSRGPS